MFLLGFHRLRIAFAVLGMVVAIACAPVALRGSCETFLTQPFQAASSIRREPENNDLMTTAHSSVDRNGSKMPTASSNDNSSRQQSRVDPAAAPNSVTDAMIIKELGKLLEQAVAADDFSGAVLLAKNDRQIFAKAYGLANKARNTANNTDTKFNIGSLSKMFTAVAVAQLAERGKLSFSDKVGKLLPNYPNREVASNVTVHQLLTHTSGMGHYHNEKYFANLHKMKTIADLLPLFVDEPLAFEPGTEWQYSNAGYVVLGLIIEKVSGQNYFDYVKEHIFNPAGMIDTDSYEHSKPVPNIAVGYTRMSFFGGSDSSNSRRENRRPARGSPAGGGYSTVGDLLRFSLALRSNKLLSQKYTDLVMQGKIEVGAPVGKYAYGFSDKNLNGKLIVGHNGGGPGIGANFDMFPRSGYTAVILTNYDAPAMAPVIARLRELIPAD